MKKQKEEQKRERPQVDSLVRGAAGFTDRAVEGRVYRVSPHGWVSALDTTHHRQVVMHEGRFEVVGPPRPAARRTDVPDRLRY